MNYNNYENLRKSIEDLIYSGREMAECALSLIEPEINELISNKSESVEAVERNLDYLLDLVPFGYGDSLFKKLNDYYTTFMPDNAKVYKSFYENAKDYSSSNK